jgi:hypothetical protein
VSLQNFIISVFDAQYGKATAHVAMARLSSLDDTLNIIFTFAFTAELVVNIYAHWFHSFVRNGWNWCAAPIRNPTDSEY